MPSRGLGGRRLHAGWRADTAPPDRVGAAGRGRIRRPRRGHAPGERQGRERKRRRSRRQHRHHVRRGQRRSRTGPRADQGRRERQTGEPAGQLRHYRSVYHRFRADPRRSAQGRRRSQFQDSQRRNAPDGRRAQRQGGRGQGAAGRRSGHQRQGNLGRTIRADVGRRAKPGRHGEVPGVEAARTWTITARSISGSARSSRSLAPRT